ncbi:putative membrane protein [Nocardioides terrae]|uniref:Putative membrane protein n=1 Tax=Nocardioides terrae TaxID=574651 RepID=A0A1I1KMF6_9ACTN|nr:DUF202 domain-containing protein [Nocardioides terrae]SFC58600.1 putative membrane protein [Nocardioides terrae]
MRRFPNQVYAKGDEPDPRFSLANERTFLAWVRTALALFAAGVALEALDLPAHAGLRAAAALTFVVVGFVATMQAWIGWSRTERALRLSRPLPGPTAGIVVVGGACAAMVVLAVGFAL